MAFLQQRPHCVLGVDIASSTIVIAGACGKAASLPNSPAAIGAMLARLRPDFVVCEPTGGHERKLIDACAKAGIACHRVVTGKVKGFIRSFGVMGKSDAIDAVMLARYGADRWASLKLSSPQTPADQELSALVRRRQQLIAMRVAEKNRAQAPGREPALAASFKVMLAVIERQLAQIDKAIAACMRTDQQLNLRVDACAAMSGVGVTTAAALVALVPELGHMSRRQAAALTGLAPHPNESGTNKGYRRTRGGRSDIRPLLYMPALTAAQGKGEFAAFYKRLVTAGKKPAIALTAVMRKIIITLNARLRDEHIQQS
jgi:transposase